MLRSLHIRNYVLIDSLDISFPEGLVIITGQTGAGKSILLGALSLLTGTKGDASIISEGAESCVVEGEFEIKDSDGSVKALLDENEVEWENGSLLIRRVVHSTGRSRSFINDSPVQVQLLSEIAAHLVDIHSQHQSLRLADKAFQQSVLDGFAQALPDVEACRAAWKKLQKTEADLADARQRLAALDSEREFNQSRFDQLDKAAIRPGELAELEEEQKQLANAEEIKTCLQAAYASLDPQNDDIPGSCQAMREAQRQLERIAQYIPQLKDLAERLESARLELEDIQAEIESADSRVNLSEDRLQQVDERIAALYELFRRFGCRTEEELVEQREKYSEALFDSSTLEDRISQLEAQQKAVRKEYDSASASLGVKRRKAAPELARSIQDSVRFLELDRAVFAVDVEPAQASASGTDAVAFRFSSTGSAPADISKCASGGEISRIMLCLKAIMARYYGMPTMIFDEIDTGVSGSAAAKMGSIICDMGKDMQVFAITHLPQVAARGEAHYVVEKAVSEGRTTSSLHQVDGDQRVAEIARLLSGTTVTAEALANAKSLLKEV